MQPLSSTTRFSDRTANYEKYRPHYPDETIAWLEKTTGLHSQACIADVGSGTGIFSALLLQHGYTVKAVEPNSDMRAVAERNLHHYPDFISIDGTAEQTTLTGKSIDLITAAQAFHWFNIPVVKREFQRIIKPGGYALLVWNILQQSTPFLKKYTVFKNNYATDLKHTHRADPDNIRIFFEPREVISKQFCHTQLVNEEEVQGLLLSSSTIPAAGPDHEKMIRELKQLFDDHQKNGKIQLIYETQLYLAPVSR